MSGGAFAASEADCAAQWKSADGNGDGVLVGPQADRYLAYYRVRAQVTPADGRITQAAFMQACRNDVFMAKAPESGAPLKGANSFTESQAKDRALAAGFTSVSSLVKDGDGVWARHRHEGRQEREGGRRLQGATSSATKPSTRRSRHEDHRTRLRHLWPGPPGRGRPRGFGHRHRRHQPDRQQVRL